MPVAIGGEAGEAVGKVVHGAGAEGDAVVDAADGIVVLVLRVVWRVEAPRLHVRELLVG